MKKLVNGDSVLDRKVVKYVESIREGLSRELLGYEISRHMGEVGTLTLEFTFDTDLLEETGYVNG
jgi:hypothetical protein